MGKSTINVVFSIAMLNYQRVICKQKNIQRAFFDTFFLPRETSSYRFPPTFRQRPEAQVLKNSEIQQTGNKPCEKVKQLAN